MNAARWILLALIAVPTVAEADSPRRVMIVPAEGSIAAPLGDAPTRITSAIMDAAKASGASVEMSAATRADLMALVGCDESDAQCSSKFPGALDVDLVVLIAVATATDGLSVDIDIAQRRGAASRTSWIVAGSEVNAIVEQVARKAPALFGGKELPPPTPPKSPERPDTVTPPPLPPRTRDPEGDEPGGSALSRVKLWSWIIAGGGVAMMTAGGVLFVQAGNRQDSIDSAPTGTLDDLRGLEAAENDARSRALWGNVLGFSGLAAVGVGTALIVIQLRSEPEGGRLSLSPLTVDGGVGLGLTFRGEL